MSQPTTFERPNFAALILAVMALCVLGSIYAYNENPATECGYAQSAYHESAPNSPSTNTDQSGADELEENGDDTKHAESCFLGHNAEQWLALLTAWLVAGTFLLAAYTALLWSEAKASGEKTALLLTEIDRGVIYFPDNAFHLCTVEKGELKEIERLTPNQEIFLRIDLQNYGKASAIIDRIAIIWHTGQEPEEIAAYGPENAQRDILRLLPQGTHQSVWVTKVPFVTDWPSLRKIWPEGLALYPYGFVRYKTLGESWDQGFLLRWIGPRPESETAEALDVGYLKDLRDASQFWTVRRSPKD